jgi:phospholipid transport system substrate-binding protein
MKRRLLTQCVLLTLASSPVFVLPAYAAEEAPDALIERLTKEALDTIEKDPSVQAGDVGRIMQLLEEKVMPHLDFQRMTA